MHALNRKLVVLSLLTFVVGLVFLINIGNILQNAHLYSKIIFQLITVMMVFGGGIFLLSGLELEVQIDGGWGMIAAIIVILIIFFFLLGGLGIFGVFG